MSDPTMCRGRDTDGNQCICMRCTATHVVDDKVICKSCGHIESAHPEPRTSVDSVLNRYRDAGRLIGSSTKASKEEAEAETNAGLRKRQRSQTDTEPPSKRSKADKGKEKEKSNGKLVEYGKLVFLTGGVSESGLLLQTKVPSPQYQNELRGAGLVVLSSPDSQLAINTAWSNRRVNQEVKRWVPDAISYLERQRYAGNPGDSPEVKKQLWLACTRDGKQLMLAGDSLPTGVELADHVKTRGTAKSDRVLYLVSKAKISSHRYLNWKDPESEMEIDELGSDVDSVPSEDIEVQKPAPKKHKGKARAAVKQEIIDDTDMKQAAKKRTGVAGGTRLSTGTVKWNNAADMMPKSTPEDIPESAGGEVLVVSDSDEEFPPAPGLGGSPAPVSAIAGAFSPPLNIPPTHVSPIQSQSPEADDPPTFFDDFDLDSFVSVPTSSLFLPVAQSSSSTLGSTTGASSSGSTPVWATTSDAGSSSGVGGDTSTEVSSATVGQRPRFRRMGKGRADRNPWTMGPE
ncbi:hypothetical protein B0H11DRAFT_2275799 [Mycena galericulata]|nr:hypothetical protein B0H11DRAFT_2275799 [Mycena galericulata]